MILFRDLYRGGWGCGGGGGGGGGHWTLWFLPYNAACSDDSFFFYKGQVKSPILHNTRVGQSSIFLTFRTICNFRFFSFIW